MRRSVVLLICLSLLVPAGQRASAEVSSSSDSSLDSAAASPVSPFSSPALLSPPHSPAPGVLDPDLARALNEAGFDDVLHVIIVLIEQATPEDMGATAATGGASRSKLVAGLQALADRTQAPLRAYLEDAKATGLVESYTPFWIFNGIAVRARRPTVLTLAAQPDVSAIHLDHYRRWLDAESTSLNPDFARPQFRTTLSQSPVEWGVARIRADQVWASLQISGTGTVVAGMDTGVDWLHPDLEANYRGHNPHGVHNHASSWFDAVNGSLYPVDDHGHGTHTVGTAVGRGGTGVAPGAKWIGVKVLDTTGSGYDSWIHAGFQWLLEPGGYSTQAPDVVNCSWGSDSGFLTTFQADVQMLRAGGILPVFSNGNAGPGEGTGGSPASLPEAFGVGATDEYDSVASFSSRGPSPWGEIRPHVAAPGVRVRSSLPGGIYGVWDGTSMAAPHVSGLVALLRSVSPTLSITRAMFVITSTVLPLGDPIPNNDTGWGRVDAFAAVAAVLHPGFITGTVSSSGDGTPIAGATVTAAPHGGSGGGKTTTDAGGEYLLALVPATYDLTTSAFGYSPETVWGIGVTTGTTTVRDFSLTPLPTGILRGQVTDADTAQPLTVTVTALDTPFAVTASTYTFALPSGTYVLRARRLGYNVLTATAVVTAGRVTTVDLTLPSAPAILLVDSGIWYYRSQAGYFRQALDALTYAYDEWPVRRLPDDVPAASDLAPYDVVVWSAPGDAPGNIGAEDAIVDYLSDEGRLLLSGQDVGYLDAGGWEFFPYYRDYLKSKLVRDNAETWMLDGVPGDIFSGMTVTITGAGGADNQTHPDEISIADPDGAAPVLAYQGDGCGGVRVGTCLDYRVVYLSFGFEAINDRAVRQEVMERALRWLVADPPTVGLELTPTAQTRVGVPGDVVTHTLRLRHVGQGGVTDTISISHAGYSWDTHLNVTESLLAPCSSTNIVVSVTIPLTAEWDVRDVTTVTAHSSISLTLAETAVLTTKTPAPILLVDDDLFFEQRQKYEAALGDVGFRYDLWQTCPATGWCRNESPPLEILQRYPIVVWWTGYDWHRPVTADEETSLQDYLRGGGRLFLSSQDFLYYHYDSPFSRDSLGVLTYTEAVTPTMARGVPGDSLSADLGPWSLHYPSGYQNWSDAVEPTPGTGVIFRDQSRRGIGLARREEDHATAFLAFPFEALPEEARPAVMERTVGWLSWLGDSNFTADHEAVTAGHTVTYTLTVRNDGLAEVTASVSNTLPVSLTLITGTLTGPAVYTPATRFVAWVGPLEPQAAVTITYQAIVAAGLPAGTSIANPARLGLEHQLIQFHRTAAVRVGRPDLSSSAFWFAPSPARSGAVITGGLALANTGPGDAPTATAVISLPMETALVSGSLASPGWGTTETLPDAVRWTGPLSAERRITLTYQLTMPLALTRLPLYSVGFLEDGLGGAWEQATWLHLAPWQVILPLVYRGN